MNQYSNAKKQSIYLFLAELRLTTNMYIKKFKHDNKSIKVDMKFFESSNHFFVSFPSKKMNEVYFAHAYKNVVNGLVKSGHILHVKWGREDGNTYFTRIKLTWKSLNTDWESLADGKKYKSVTKIRNKKLTYNLNNRFSEPQAEAILQECEYKFDDCLTLPSTSSTYQYVAKKCYERYLEVDDEQNSFSEYLKVIDSAFEHVKIWNEMTPLERTRFYKSKRFYDKIQNKVLGNGRIYSFFTRLPREFRKYIICKQLFDLDISACHPHLFCLGSKELNASVDLSNTRFYKLLQRGRLYEYVADRLDISLGEAKIKVQEWFNCKLIYKTGQLSPKHIEFSSVFPEVEDVVHKIKKRFGWKYVGAWLSYKEAEFIHGPLTKRLLEEDIRSIKIHDGFLTDAPSGDYVNNILSNELIRHFGVSIPTTVKVLKRNYSVI